MGTKITFDPTLGVKQETVVGNGTLELNTPLSMSTTMSSSGFAPYKLPVTAFTTGSTVTVGQAGLLTIAGSNPSSVVMPTAASCPGALFTIRTTSAVAHFLTGSQEADGTRVFTDGTSSGSKVTLGAVAGSSVCLLSDGKSFLVLGNSGSLTFATP